MRAKDADASTRMAGRGRSQGVFAPADAAVTGEERDEVMEEWGAGGGGCPGERQVRWAAEGARARMARLRARDEPREGVREAPSRRRTPRRSGRGVGWAPCRRSVGAMISLGKWQ